MKRYNLSEIMRNAHRTYKYVGKKQGNTFGEVLKATCKAGCSYSRIKGSTPGRRSKESRRVEELQAC